jgi:SagB-type dehydrogenase family enzyme
LLALPISAAADDSLSIGQRFHHETSFDDNGYVGENVRFGDLIAPYKTYEGVPRTKLPTPAELSMAVDEAINRRASVRSFADRAISLEQLSRLLLSAGGITHKRGDWEMRAAPSGGALYPMEIYVVAANVTGLPNGLYHFQVSDSSLEQVKLGNFGERVRTAANDQASVGSSPVTLMMTARFDRSTHKYGDRGYRYTYIETGAVCQNVYLAATSMGMGTVAVGAFNDESANDFLDVDGLNEATLLVMPVGFPAE